MAHDISKNNPRINSAARKVPTLARPVVTPERQLAKIERSQKINHNLADQTARRQAESESRRRYHAAWQEYYQKYYQHYYLKQLEEQKRQAETEAAEKLSPKQQAIDELRHQLLAKLSENTAKVKKSKHFKPILAGLVAVLLLVFVQYNQLFSAAIHGLVAPGDGDSVIIVADNSSRPTHQSPTLMIPKLSITTPVIFDVESQTEASSQAALEQGVIWFPVSGASAKPGQNGNTVILGHSSSDIFNAGQYKFIFVQLNRLALGDLFYIDYQDTRYSYEVTDRKIIAPTDLQDLNLGVSAPFASLITCDPPGTTLNRLVVIGRQVSPQPSADDKTQATPDQPSRPDIPGNPPTLFERLFN
jgi:sortase A